MIRILPSLVPLLLASVASAQLTCTSTPVASSCATLSVTFTPQGMSGNQTITVSATGLHPQAQGVMNWGLQTFSAPLPGGCLLLCDFVWGHKFVSNDVGEFSWSRNWPHWYQQYFYMQVGTWELVQGNLEFISTDCKYSGCQ
jgi:hypothetical protein